MIQLNLPTIDFNELILAILSIDTIRSIIAAMGVIKHETPFLGRLIYGKYDIEATKEALKELGYNDQNANKEVQRLKNVIKNDRYPQKDTALKLIYIMSKYITEFENNISYGMIEPNKNLSQSKYYINTMEAVHNVTDLKELSHIMERLMKYYKEDRVDFIIVPKGGNPILAQYIANELGAQLILAKDINDSARPQETDELERLSRIRYEGLDLMLKKTRKEKYKGVVLDCNTSGGTQLVNIIKDFNNVVCECNLPIQLISDCYVLFKLVKVDSDSGQVIDINKKFTDNKCELHRFFDVDEEDKKNIFSIQTSDYHEAYDLGKLHSVLTNIKNKSRYYYKK